MTSPSGQYALVMQGDGNLVVYRSGGVATWSSRTAGTGNWAVFQGDGNFVVYSAANVALWSSQTGGFDGGRLYLQDDGNLVIYQGGRARWSLNGALFDRLTPGQTLAPGESIKSVNREYDLIMQGDGNLVVYRTGGQAIWNTQTSGTGNWAVMQGDGNLVVYSPTNVAMWHSQTGGNPGAYLVMQDDGNLVVYDAGVAIWSSKGGMPGNPTTDALTRGQSWVDAQIPYSQQSWYTNQYGRYRQDCSGFVSMMWGLNASYTTSSLPQVSHPIMKEQLQPGDILLNVSSHVVLFAGWADAAHTKYYAYEQTPPRAHRVAIPYPYWPGYGTYIPYRKN